MAEDTIKIVKKKNPEATRTPQLHGWVNERIERKRREQSEYVDDLIKASLDMAYEQIKEKYVKTSDNGEEEFDEFEALMNDVTDFDTMNESQEFSLDNPVIIKQIMKRAKEILSEWYNRDDHDLSEEDKQILIDEYHKAREDMEKTTNAKLTEVFEAIDNKFIIDRVNCLRYLKDNPMDIKSVEDIEKLRPTSNMSFNDVDFLAKVIVYAISGSQIDKKTLDSRVSAIYKIWRIEIVDE